MDTLHANGMTAIVTGVKPVPTGNPSAGGGGRHITPATGCTLAASPGATEEHEKSTMRLANNHEYWLEEIAA